MTITINTNILKLLGGKKQFLNTKLILMMFINKLSESRMNKKIFFLEETTLEEFLTKRNINRKNIGEKIVKDVKKERYFDFKRFKGIKYTKRGFLLMNTGSPDSPEVADVKNYLGQFLMDPYVIDLPYPARALLGLWNNFKYETKKICRSI